MVAALVDSLSLAPVSIVGSCTGAAMALNYALQNPRKVKRLILFHIATEGTAAGGSLERTIRLVGGRPFATRVISPFVEAAMSRGALHKRIIRDQYGCDFADTAVFLEHMHRLYGKRGQATCLLRLFGNWKSFAPLDKAAYPADFPPLHVFWGDSNRVLPLKRGQKLRESLRPHSWEVIEGGGHLVMRERPELVNRRMDEIMQSTDRL
jgi:pimeloyl-ACP methyl ester carboxylesterase